LSEGSVADGPGAEVDRVFAIGVEVGVLQRRDAFKLTSGDELALGAELVDRELRVDGVPDHDRVDDESQAERLLLLLVGVAVPRLAFVGVEQDAPQPVEVLALVQLPPVPSAELLVAEPFEDEVRLDQPPVFLQRSGDRVPRPAGLEAEEQQRRGRPPVLERRGEAEQRVAVRGDELGPEAVAEQFAGLAGREGAVLVEALAVQITGSLGRSGDRAGRRRRRSSRCSRACPWCAPRSPARFVAEDPVEGVGRVADVGRDHPAVVLAVLV
jgi:hypothetical protein